MGKGNRKGRIVDRDRTPEKWPTVHVPPVFWEEYGRTIGTFAALGHNLRRQPAVSKSHNKILKSVAMLRNSMCHGSWVDYNQDTGVATLRYWRKKGWRQGATSQNFSKDDLEEISRANLSLIRGIVEEWNPNLIASAFWEEYGRTIGTFTALEDNLMRADFMITGTHGHTFQTDGQARDAFASWLHEREDSMNETMGKLIRRIVKTINDDDRYPSGSGTMIDEKLQQAVECRNVLINGWWVSYDNGVAILRSWEGQKCTSRTFSMEDHLAEIRRMGRDVLIDIVNSVTHLGHQFPGESDDT